MKIVLLPLILHVLVLLGGEVAAQDMEVPADVQYPLLLKILTLDRNLEAKNDGEIVWGVAYQSQVRESWRSMQAFVDASKNTTAQLKNARVRLLPIEVNNMDDLERTIKQHRIDVLYVTPLRAVDIRKIAAVARALQVRSLTGVPGYVVEGLAIGIGLRGDKPEILINLAATQAEGADFNPQILRLAHIVDR